MSLGFWSSLGVQAAGPTWRAEAGRVFEIQAALIPSLFNWKPEIRRDELPSQGEASGNPDWAAGRQWRCQEPM